MDAIPASLTVLRSRFFPLLAVVALFCIPIRAFSQPVNTHLIKCATPLLAAPLRPAPLAGPYPTTYPLPTGFPDSLLSPSGRFMIYYYAHSADPDSTAAPNFPERAAEDADSAYDFEIGDLGYTPPAFTEGTHYNIYLTSFHTPNGYEAYGATFILDTGQLPDSPSGNYRFRSYVQTDNAFTSSIFATHGLDALRITIFHEFFHMIQFSGYGHPPNFAEPYPDYVFFQEMSSVWMEWLSTPTVKDYLNYVPDYLSTLDVRFDETPSNGYGQYIFFAYLTNRFQDTSIVKKIWQYYRDSSGDPITCIDEVLRRDYNSSFCQEYERFGAEVIQTGRRYNGETEVPDPELLPVDTIPITAVPPNTSIPIQTVGLTLQFFETGSGADSCIEVLARDTNRKLLSNGTIEFTSAGSSPTLTLDVPSAYCDTEVCIAPTFAQVFPDPFIPESSSLAYLYAAATKPISVAMNILDINMNEIRSTKVPAVPFRGAWTAIWDGLDDNGKPVSSGEYLYSLHVDGALKVGKIVVVRK